MPIAPRRIVSAKSVPLRMSLSMAVIVLARGQPLGGNRFCRVSHRKTGLFRVDRHGMPLAPLETKVFEGGSHVETLRTTDSNDDAPRRGVCASGASEHAFLSADRPDRAPRCSEGRSPLPAGGTLRLGWLPIPA